MDSIDKLTKALEELNKSYDELDSFSITGIKKPKVKEVKPVKVEDKPKDKVKKDEGPDKETKNFLNHWEPKTKHPKEPTAGMASGKAKGTKTTSTGFKLKLVKALENAGYRESALLLKNWGEEDYFALFMRKQLEKSNYGPKGTDAYSEKDNIKRKSNRTGVQVDGAGKNLEQKNWSKGGRGSTKDQLNLEAKKIKAKNKKQPVKVFSEAEKRALEEKYNKKDK